MTRKYVVVEKPFTVNTAEADRMLAVAKKSNKILTVFQNRRYDSDFLTLQSVPRKSALGTITEAELHYDVDFPYWISGWTSPTYSPGSGMFYWLGSHTIDQALTLFGAPATVTGFHRSLRRVDSETDDTSIIILQYNGVQKNLLVTVKSSVVAVMRDSLKYFVTGHDGTFMKYGTDPQEGQIGDGMKATDEGFGVEVEDIWGGLTTKEKVDARQAKDERSGRWIGRVKSEKGHYVGYYSDFVKAIRDGEIQVRPEQSRDGIGVIELARESAEKGYSLPV